MMDTLHHGNIVAINVINQLQPRCTQPKKFLNTYIFNNNIKSGDRSILKLGMYVGQHLICA